MSSVPIRSIRSLQRQGPAIAANLKRCHHSQYFSTTICSLFSLASDLSVQAPISVRLNHGKVRAFSSIGACAPQERCADDLEAASDPLLSHFPNRMVTSGLGPVFEPRSVAVIGATDRPGSVGRTLVNNLILGNEQGGHKYKIYPINPTRKTVLGLPCFSKLSEIPGDVDMAVVVTPAKTCVEVMKECANKGVKAAVVISAGFKEAGPAGIALENELIRVARDAGIRVIGPNCVGVMNPNFGLNATFAATIGLPGNVAFISQSGAMCTSVLDWSLREKVGFSAFISVGSMADVHWGDMIDYLGADPNTDSILIYMETVGDAHAFLSAAREASLTKPIVVIKAGKSEQAAKAAASHTGSLAGSYKSFEAAMSRVGVLTVDTIQELCNITLVLSKQPLPHGPNLMLVTNAGGPAVLATDAAVGSGAVLPDIEEKTRERLNQFLPPAWSHHNPVDILGDASAELYAKALEVCLEDSHADGVLVILSPQDVTDPTMTAKELIKAVDVIKQKSSTHRTKPILAAWMGGESVAEGFRLLNQAGIPTFANPDDAAATFGKIWKRTAELNTLYEKQKSVDTAFEPTSMIAPEKRSLIIKILKDAARAGRTLLTEAESKEVLSSYGIPIVETVIATTVDAATAAAHRLNAPLYAVKLHSETLTHKADVGGVKLNLKAADVGTAFEQIRKSVLSLHGPQHFQGVTVQPMMRLDKGLELILGSTADPQFGPLVMFGTGGTMVEVFKDTALAVPPLTANLAQKLMKQTKIYKALKGGHGKRFEGVDLLRLEGILSRFSAMAVDLSEHVAECDINPLLAMKDGFVVLDARFALTTPGASRGPLAVRPYPLNYVSSVSLSNNEQLTLRPIHSADEEQLRQFHQLLSPATVGLHYVSEVPLQKRIEKNKMIVTCYADYDRVITLLAINKAKEIVGLFQMERPPLNHLHRETASIRLVVADAFQSVGLDLALMKSAVQIAKSEDVRKLQAPVLAKNTKFVDLAEKLGWKCGAVDNHGIRMCTLNV